MNDKQFGNVRLSAPATTSCMVLEPQGVWGPRIRHQLREIAVDFKQLRSIEECRQELTTQPYSIVVMVATPRQVDRIVSFLEEIPIRFPPAKTIIAVPSSLNAPFGCWKELGAVHVISSIRHVPEIVRIVKRFAIQTPRQVSEDIYTVRVELPWKANRSNGSDEV